MEKTVKTKGKIAGEIIEWVLIVLAIVYVAFIAIFASKNPTNNQSSSIFGFETRLVVSGSMEADKSYYKGKDYKVKQIKTGSLVFLESAPPAMERLNQDKTYSAQLIKFVNSIKIGDVVTFIPETGTSDSITHRVINKIEDGGKIRFETRGDVATSEGETTVESFEAVNIDGKVIGTSAFLGWMYLKVFSNKPLMATFIIVPCGIIAAYEIIKIISVVKEDKKVAVSESGSLKDDEESIEELEKKLAELKKKKGEK